MILGRFSFELVGAISCGCEPDKPKGKVSQKNPKIDENYFVDNLLVKGRGLFAILAIYTVSVQDLVNFIPHNFWRKTLL